jgi:hypothetical protein
MVSAGMIVSFGCSLTSLGLPDGRRSQTMHRPFATAKGANGLCALARRHRGPRRTLVGWTERDRGRGLCRGGNTHDAGTTCVTTF